VELSVSCRIIRDLIPLVKDGVASDDSARLVTEHVKRCEMCKAEFDLCEGAAMEPHPSIQDEKIIAAIRRSIYATRLAVLFIGAVVGVALSNSMGMFYNLLIMPAVGALSLFVFQRKWYAAALAVLALTFGWQTVTGAVSYGFDRAALYEGVIYGAIYSALVGLGVLIAKLLTFAFGKGGKR